ncbi:protein terminal ear1 homolog [Rutidosis leptorrhynchoides]|uniref:protein terminal ear1 homolog n=1 Tax=Rutidosis leptorrhynchoides TaxID=125765 RepID=UPI003A9A4D9A
MEDTGSVRFSAALDPRAQEFWPLHQLSHPQLIPFYAPPPPHQPPLQIFYPYTSAPLSPFQPQNDVLALPFSYPPSQPPFATPAPNYFENHHHHHLQTPPAVPQPAVISTRALVLTYVPTDASESLIRRELEVFGEVRGVQMEKVRDGIVTVHFYDLRHAERALREIREQHIPQHCRDRNQLYSAAPSTSSLMVMTHPLLNSSGINVVGAPQQQLARGLIAGHAVWAHFTIPASNAVPGGSNQGTIVVFHLDDGVSSGYLRDVFSAFGDVKELRETPMKKRQRFVEFYDVRDAAKALSEMNGNEIRGRQVVIEFSRPGGFGRKYGGGFPSNNIRRSEFPPPMTSKFSSGHMMRSPPRNSSRFLPSHSKPSVQKPWSFNSKGKNHSNGSVVTSLDYLSLSDHHNLTEDGARNDGFVKNSHRGKNIIKQQEPRCNNRPPRPRPTKKSDARFLICDYATTTESGSGAETRTTVMIKNIPNKYSQKLVLSMLDNHCIHTNEQKCRDGEDDEPMSSYDFVYLPIDFNNKCNVGYGFVNMTSPQAAWRLYKAFHQQHWEVFNSRKICEVTYARVQGLEALKEHFKNSKFPCEMDHYLPVIFSPPRDGKQLTEPQPIVGQLHKSMLNETPNSDHADLEGEDDPIGGGGGSSSSCISTQYSSSFGGGGSDGFDIEDDDQFSGCGLVLAS